MKRFLVFSVILGFGFLLLQARKMTDKKSFTVPEEVAEVLQTSCNDCHTNAAKSDKARDALNFDEWDSYQAGKQVRLLADICKLVNNDKMPTEKYLKQKPAAALDESQKKLLCDWAEVESEKILGGSK